MNSYTLAGLSEKRFGIIAERTSCDSVDSVAEWKSRLTHMGLFDRIYDSLFNGGAKAAVLHNLAEVLGRADDSCLVNSMLTEVFGGTKSLHRLVDSMSPQGVAKFLAFGEGTDLIGGRVMLPIIKGGENGDGIFVPVDVSTYLDLLRKYGSEEHIYAFVNHATGKALEDIMSLPEKSNIRGKVESALNVLKMIQAKLDPDAKIFSMLSVQINHCEQRLSLMDYPSELKSAEKTVGLLKAYVDHKSVGGILLDGFAKKEFKITNFHGENVEITDKSGDSMCINIDTLTKAANGTGDRVLLCLSLGASSVDWAEIKSVSDKDVADAQEKLQLYYERNKDKSIEYCKKNLSIITAYDNLYGGPGRYQIDTLNYLRSNSVKPGSNFVKPEFDFKLRKNELTRLYDSSNGEIGFGVDSKAIAELATKDVEQTHEHEMSKIANKETLFALTQLAYNVANGLESSAKMRDFGADQYAQIATGYRIGTSDGKALSDMFDQLHNVAPHYELKQSDALYCNEPLMFIYNQHLDS